MYPEIAGRLLKEINALASSTTKIKIFCATFEKKNCVIFFCIHSVLSWNTLPELEAIFLKLLKRYYPDTFIFPFSHEDELIIRPEMNPERQKLMNGNVQSGCVGKDRKPSSKILLKVFFMFLHIFYEIYLHSNFFYFLVFQDIRKNFINFESHKRHGMMAYLPTYSESYLQCWMCFC